MTTKFGPVCTLTGRTQPFELYSLAAPLAMATLFQGRRWDKIDGDRGLYYYRHRYLDPDTGRFLTRDPGNSSRSCKPCRMTNGNAIIGEERLEVMVRGGWYDALNVGNAYLFVGNNVPIGRDPSGLLKIYVWPSTSGTSSALVDRSKNIGHVAMELCPEEGQEDGLYISAWPGENGDLERYWDPSWWEDKGADPSDVDSDSEQSRLRKSEEWRREEHREPDVYDLGCCCLDEAAIADWWRSYRQAAKWGLTVGSCSNVVIRGLRAGGADIGCFISTPDSVGSLFEAMAEECAKKSRGDVPDGGFSHIPPYGGE